ncbi:MAG: RagB/SusD family nutrient uptake outer membrane protein [Haliscomenobacteraceae bacterium CHB4]|nr:RagB/SusD family nutrient uptake outer membrane protein [Haliscomenobacteraceae bacterium CHB4]
MKNIKYIFKSNLIVLLALAALLIPNACQKDLLDPVPKNLLSDATIFATPDRFDKLVNGIYDNLKNGAFYGGRIIVYGDIRAEEFLNETTNGVTGFGVWNHTVTESSVNDVTNLWNAVYQTINACNIFIVGADANRAVLNDDVLANRYIAEARFVRALCYHSLLRYYCRPYADGNGSQLGVPLRLTPETGPGNNDLARSTVAEVYNQILDDLNWAEQNLAATNSGLTNVTRAHKNAAIAMKVRVLLSMQRYNDAITEANKIVSAGAPFTAPSGIAHALQANVKNVFTSPYTTTESIFSMPFTSNDLPGVQNGLGSYYNPGPRGIGDYSLNPAGIIGDSVNFPVTDARRQFVFINTNNKPYLNKFPLGPEHLDYAPVLRYAETLLSLAEAEARENGVNQRSVDLLNAVRGRSDASVVFDIADFATADDLINAILLERRIELLGEGFRAFDTMRLLAPIPGKANVATILPTVSDYIWPIPSGELATNKLCVQNP